jgi:hypothetical protein
MRPAPLQPLSCCFRILPTAGATRRSSSCLAASQASRPQGIFASFRRRGSRSRFHCANPIEKVSRRRSTEIMPNPICRPGKWLSACEVPGWGSGRESSDQSAANVATRLRAQRPPVKPSRSLARVCSSLICENQAHSNRKLRPLPSDESPRADPIRRLNVHGPGGQDSTQDGQ